MEMKLLFPPQKVDGYFGEPTVRRWKELWRNSHLGGTVCNPGTGLLITVWRRYAHFVRLQLQFFTSVIWRNFDAKRDLQKISRRELPPRCFGKKVFIPDQPLKSAKS